LKASQLLLAKGIKLFQLFINIPSPDVACIYSKVKKLFLGCFTDIMTKKNSCLFEYEIETVA